MNKRSLNVIVLARCSAVFLFLISVSVYGQAPSKLDSLVSKLQVTSKGQTRLTLYENICAYYVENRGDLTLATQYADSLKLLSKELDDEKGFFKSQLMYGIIAQHQSNYEVAQKLLSDYIEYSKSQGDSTQVAKGLFHHAVVGIYLGDFDKSLATFYRILAIEEKSNNKKKVATILNSIGAVYKQINKLNDAIVVYNEAAAIFKAANIRLDYAMCLANLGNIYLAVKKYDSAEQAYDEALNIFYDFNNPTFIATTLGNLGNLYEARHEYNLALRNHLKALTLWRKDTKKRSLANCLINLGKTCVALKKYTEAYNYLKEAVLIGEDIKAKPILAEAYEVLRMLYVEKNQFENAYHYLMLSKQISDSIFNESNTKQINELQAKFDAATKDKKLILLAKERQIQEKEMSRQSTVSKAIAGGLGLIILIAALVVYIFRQRLVLTGKNIQVKEAEFKRQVSELEMKALRAQINPHFLFNCMNAINLMLLKGQTESASLYLTKFSKMVRLILENAEASVVTLESEIALLESYIKLEDLRLPGRINYKISVAESIDTQTTYLPSMILQPVVENAIWHGIVHKEIEAKGVILIDVRQSDERLCFTIEDNGVGRERAAQLRDKSLLQNKSMGMKITEQRLRLLSRKNVDHCLEIADLKDNSNQAVGTRVVLFIPIAEQND